MNVEAHSGALIAAIANTVADILAERFLKLAAPHGHTAGVVNLIDALNRNTEALKEHGTITGRGFLTGSIPVTEVSRPLPATEPVRESLADAMHTGKTNYQVVNPYASDVVEVPLPGAMKEVTVDDAVEKVTKLLKLKNRVVVVNILAKHGAKGVTDVKDLVSFILDVDKELGA